MKKINQTMYAQIFKEIMYGPITAQDAVEVSGIHLVTAQELMRCLKRHKVIHICAWEKDSMGRDQTPVYMLGEGRDKKRATLTAAERMARHRAKKKRIAAQLNVMGMAL